MKPKSPAPFKGYARYSGMAFQMAAIIALGSYGGLKLDEALQTKPLFIIVGSLASIALALYIVIKDTTPKNDNKNAKNRL